MNPRESMEVLPAYLQPFLTWVTGKPRSTEKPKPFWSPLAVAVLAFLQTVAGMLIGYVALKAGPFSELNSVLLVVSWLTTAGGLRRFDVLVIHQSLHGKVVRSASGNRLIGEILTTILWRMPYDSNRREHFMHHSYPCSMKDADTIYLLKTGFQPGMRRSQAMGYIFKMLFSLQHHYGFLKSRLLSNFKTDLPMYRLCMSYAYLFATVASLTYFHLWLEWVVLWLVPCTFFFQNATFLYTHTEHRWWVHQNRERLSPSERDDLNFGRMCGRAVPDNKSIPAWLGWWSELLFVLTPYRLFVLVGDTVQHDLHHVAPQCDWPNSDVERFYDLQKQPHRYTECWGNITHHLFEAMGVR